jgi:hypothetical protein
MRLIPPPWLLEAFRRDYFQIIGMDERNWIVARTDSDVPFVVPKKGKLTSPLVINAALAYSKQHGAQLNERIAQVTEEYYNLPDPRPQSPKPSSPIL